MSELNTHPLTQVGDGTDAVSIDKQGRRVALDVNDDAVLQLLSDVLDELRTIRELMASQL